jgi:GNAT superfamily N-acetyltransferase
MRLTRVSDAELPALAAFVNSAYRGDTARRGWTHEADYLDGQRTDIETLRSDLARPGARLLAARDVAGELIGCVWLEPAEPAVWKLGMLTVSPERQAGGLGRELLAAAEAEAARQGAGRIRLTVIGIREALIAWYERRGYVRTGAEEAFPYGDARFGLPTRDDLSFVIMEKPLA